MVIFLYGPDTYRRKERVDEYVRTFTDTHGPGTARFDLEEGETLANVSEFLRAQSLFGGAKLAVVRGIADVATKELKALVKTYEAAKTSHLVIEADSAPKPLAFLLKPPITAKKFEVLEGAAWKVYVEKLATAKGAVLAPRALALLAERYSGNVWGLATEIEKLAALGNAADEKDIQRLHHELAPDFWPLMQDLKSPSIERRLVALERARVSGENPAKLFNILASLWKENAAQAAACDIRIKTGKLDHEEALLALVIN